MKRASILAWICSGAAGLVWACGGVTTSDLDGGSDGSPANDGGGGQDGGVADAGGGADAGPACPAFLTSDCDGGCPSGSVCVYGSAGPQEVQKGCLPTTQCSANEATCACLGACVCQGPGEKCSTPTKDALYCSGGPISRRAFKTDIAYVGDRERAELARQALSTHLAEYRYKAEPEGAKRHLGFIIDDMPVESPAVQGDRTHVDEYGYASMLLATVQEQQKQIDALEKQVAELRRRR